MNTNTEVRKKFVLTRKKQKGQVAIFVALIFQVVFVFFALLINVGLLVHHKINLQQSTDLAAYYGAMKQAEMLNAVSHINFQIRQSWKLLTWRYRVLGTFGFQPDPKSPGPFQKFPFEVDGNNSFYNAEDGTKCTGPAEVVDLGMQDIPFFCIGHGGFKGWTSPGDTSCKANCPNFRYAKPIRTIPTIIPVELGHGGVGATQINNAIIAANGRTEYLCDELSKFGSIIFSRFLTAYLIETNQRKSTVEMLAGNLSATADMQVDLDGKLILKGVEKTLRNNLTEANLTGLDKRSFLTLNGLNQGECAYENGKPNSRRKEFLKKIEFDFINYFIHNCKVEGGANNYKPESLYNPNGSVNSIFGLTTEIKNYLEAVFNEESKHTVGFEKNPNCVEYYAVKASATPKIPFLPIEAIKLNAVSVFKPFGGTVGPWFGKKWEVVDATSKATDTDDNTKTDGVLPFRSTPSALDANDIVKGIRQQPNFSLFVGDTKGVSDPRYLAAYHSILVKRDLPNNSKLGSYEPNNSSKLLAGPNWPAYDNWAGIESFASPTTYDSLAAQGTGTRTLEITAVAPNQFDLTYYSIDPDFYNNYLVKLYKNFDVIKSASGGRGPRDRGFLRPDFGGVIDQSIISQENQPHMEPLDPKTFSVKDQIYMKNLAFNIRPTSPNPRGPRGKYSDHFPYLATSQASLLTGWTFQSFSDFKTFPESFDGNRTMPFAKCNDTWNNGGDPQDKQNFETPKSKGEQFPPTPGNCITGGRTGYSVKMVTPAMVSSAPPEGQTAILNPLPSSFFSF